MSEWDLVAQQGAQGQSFYWGGVYAPLATYVKDSVVRYGNATYIASHTGVLGQPDLTPADWQPFALGGLNANTVLASGNVGSGVVGAASIAGSTPSYTDIPGCAVAPNVITPLTLQIRGIVALSSSIGTLTNYRLFVRAVDDLGNDLGAAVDRQFLSSAGQRLMNFAADIDVIPGSIARTYRLQESMNDSTGGTVTFGGTSFGGAGNVFRLNAVAR